LYLVQADEQNTTRLQKLVVDSGSEIHVCPAWFASEFALQPSLRRLKIRSAGGETLQHYGQRVVGVQFRGIVLSIVFEVSDVQRPLLSMAALIDHFGAEFRMGRVPEMVVGGRRLGLERSGKLFILDYEKLVKPRNEVVSVCPVEQKETEFEVPRGDGDGQPPVQQLREPEPPQEEEKRLHSFHHLPFRSWCDVCVRCKAPEDPHVLRHEPEAEKVDEPPVVQADFSFIGAMTVLSCYHTGLRHGAVTAIPRKGGNVEFAVQWLVRYLASLSVQKVVLHSDSETSIVALLRKVADRRSFATILRESPMKSHASIGSEERWHRSFQEEFRAVKLQLEQNLGGAVIEETQPICAWMLRHAAWLISRFQVSRQSGTTAFFRAFGRNYTGPIVAFGEQVFALTPAEVVGKTPRRAPKFEPRWSVGTWLGKVEESDEHLVHTKGALARFRSVRRYPREDVRKWSAPAIALVMCTPWNLRAVTPLESTSCVGKPQLKGPEGSHRAMRSFPGTVGCSACAQKGHNISGWHHTAACKRARNEWLTMQTQQATVFTREVPDTGGASSSSSPAVVCPPIPALSHRQHQKTPEQDVVMNEPLTQEEASEEGAAAKRARIVQLLEKEVSDEKTIEDDDEMDTRMYEAMMDGYTPQQVAEGDLREIQGLVDRDVFMFEYLKPSKQARIITSRIVRREKQGRVKSRLVVRDFKTASATADLYAATPSPTSLKIMLAVESVRLSKNLSRLLLFGDVSQAFVHAPLRELDELWLWLPREMNGMKVQLKAGADASTCVHVFDCSRPYRVGMALYGYRPSPRLWQDHVGGLLVASGLRRSSVDAALFFMDNLEFLLHVDDMLVAGEPSVVEATFVALQKELTLREVGRLTRAGDRASYLGHSVVRTQHGFRLQQSSELVDGLVQEFGLGRARAVSSPGFSPSAKQLDDQGQQLLVGPEIRRHRAAVGKLMYLAHGRPDAQYAAKDVARSLSAPSQLDVLKVKRLVKYLREFPVAEYIFEEKVWPKSLVAYVDSDWGGESTTRKSTSGGLVLFGNSILASWSRTQQRISLSSCEAEYYAVITGYGEMKYCQSVLKELGMDFSLQAYSDSSSAKAFAERPGVMRMKHIEMRRLFIKEVISSGELVLGRVASLQNPSDMLTKPVGAAALKRCLAELPGLKVLGRDQVVDVQMVEEECGASCFVFEVHCLLYLVVALMRSVTLREALLCRWVPSTWKLLACALLLAVALEWSSPLLEGGWSWPLRGWRIGEASHPGPRGSTSRSRSPRRRLPAPPPPWTRRSVGPLPPEPPEVPRLPRSPPLKPPPVPPPVPKPPQVPSLSSSSRSLPAPPPPVSKKPRREVLPPPPPKVPMKRLLPKPPAVTTSRSSSSVVLKPALYVKVDEEEKPEGRDEKKAVEQENLCDEDMFRPIVQAPFFRRLSMQRLSWFSGEKRLEFMARWDISAAPELDVSEAVAITMRNGVPTMAWRTGFLPEEVLFRWFVLVTQIQVYRPGWQWRVPWAPYVYYKFLHLLMARAGFARLTYAERYRENDLVLWMSTTRESCQYILGVVQGPNLQDERLLDVILLPAGPLPRMIFALKPTSLALFDAADERNIRRDLVSRDGWRRRYRSGKPMPAHRESLTQRQWLKRMQCRWFRQFKKVGMRIFIPIDSSEP
jgi:hypothetical protein